jgi:hypothetical protein
MTGVPAAVGLDGGEGDGTPPNERPTASWAVRSTIAISFNSEPYSTPLPVGFIGVAVDLSRDFGPC